MTTERILPAIALPAPGRGATRPATPVAGTRGATPVTRPAGARPAVAHRSQPFLTMPARAGILLGTSAAVYAVSLAGVASFQSADDAALAARRQPYLDAIAASRAANDALEAAIVGTDQRAQTVADRYGLLAADVTAYETGLDELATLVTRVQGSAAALPARISLPSVSIRGPIAGVSRSVRRSAPATTTTTRASGH